MRGLVFALLLCAAPAAAQVAEPVAGLGESRWLARGALADQLSSRPREVLRSEQAGGRASLQVELGRLAFRSPQALGGTARREELSCESCHAGGHVNAGFFVPGLSSRLGTIDVTHSAVRLVEPKSATVLVEILPAPVERNIGGVPVRWRNLGTGFRAVIEPSVAKVQIRGHESGLKAVQAHDIEAFVDLAGLGPGRYNLRVQIDPSQDYGISAITPAVVAVTVR